MFSNDKRIGHHVVTEFWLAPMIITRLRPDDFSILDLCKDLGDVVRSAPPGGMPRPVENADVLRFSHRSTFTKPGHLSPRAIDSNPSIRKNIITLVRYSMIFG